jgi:hypothetical protein
MRLLCSDGRERWCGVHFSCLRSRAPPQRRLSARSNEGLVHPSRPDEAGGESTAWYASFWDFCAAYLTVPLNEKWSLSPEQSLNSVPRQPPSDVGTLLDQTTELVEHAFTPDPFWHGRLRSGSSRARTRDPCDGRRHLWSRRQPSQACRAPRIRRLLPYPARGRRLRVHGE